MAKLAILLVFFLAFIVFAILKVLIQGTGAAYRATFGGEGLQAFSTIFPETVNERGVADSTSWYLNKYFRDGDERDADLMQAHCFVMLTGSTQALAAQGGGQVPIAVLIQAMARGCTAWAQGTGRHSGGYGFWHSLLSETWSGITDHGGRLFDQAAISTVVARAA